MSAPVNNKPSAPYAIALEAALRPIFEQMLAPDGKTATTDTTIIAGEISKQLSGVNDLKKKR